MYLYVFSFIFFTLYPSKHFDEVYAVQYTVYSVLLVYRRIVHTWAEVCIFMKTFNFWWVWRDTE